MSLGLDGAMPIPWLSIADHPAPGGRVASLAVVQVA
jgi:hypothetical protein